MNSKRRIILGVVIMFVCTMVVASFLNVQAANPTFGQTITLASTAPNSTYKYNTNSRSCQSDNMYSLVCIFQYGGGSPYKLGMDVYDLVTGNIHYTLNLDTSGASTTAFTISNFVNQYAAVAWYNSTSSKIVIDQCYTTYASSSTAASLTCNAWTSITPWSGSSGLPQFLNLFQQPNGYFYLGDYETNPSPYNVFYSSTATITSSGTISKAFDYVLGTGQAVTLAPFYQGSNTYAIEYPIASSTKFGYSIFSSTGSPLVQNPSSYYSEPNLTSFSYNPSTDNTTFYSIQNSTSTNLLLETMYFNPVSTTVTQTQVANLGSISVNALTATNIASTVDAVSYLSNSYIITNIVQSSSSLGSATLANVPNAWSLTSDFYSPPSNAGEFDLVWQTTGGTFLGLASVPISAVVVTKTLTFVESLATTTTVHTTVTSTIQTATVTATNTINSLGLAFSQVNFLVIVGAISAFTLCGMSAYYLLRGRSS